MLKTYLLARVIGAGGRPDTNGLVWLGDSKQLFEMCVVTFGALILMMVVLWILSKFMR